MAFIPLPVHRTAPERGLGRRPSLLVGVALLLLSIVAQGETADPPRPNILLLVAEDLSLRVGSFGDTLAHTPHVDALAASGVRYTNVFTTAGVCAPSRAALITGQHQISFGAQHMRSSTGPLGTYYAQPDPEVRAFPELLRSAGYFTFTDGKLDYQFSGIVAGTGPFTIWDREGVHLGAWRERRTGQPFFGMINFLETHESGVMRPAGEPNNLAHARTQQMRLARALVAPALTDPAAVVLPPYYPDLPEVRADLARHYDNIRAMDARVGRILDALSEDGLDESTIVIWTTDHGDGLPRAKRELFDSGLHVPLVLHVPDRLRRASGVGLPPAGSTDTRLVSFVDLAPAILELAGVALPGYLHGKPFYRSDRETVLAARDRIDEVMDRQRALRTQSFKYIRSWFPDVPGGHELAYRDGLDMVRAWRSAYRAGTLDPVQRRWFEPPGVEQLYDLNRDPDELVNLAGEPEQRETLERLSSALDADLARFGDTGELTETELMAGFLEDGEVPLTPAPNWTVVEGRLQLVSEMGASIGYRLEGEQHWQLYTVPLPLPALPMDIKAVRYGWRESGVVRVPACGGTCD